MRKIIAALAIAAGILLGTASAALASPGPGNSNQCAPGQHSGPTSPPPCPNSK